MCTESVWLTWAGVIEEDLLKETGPFQRALDIVSLTGFEPAIAFLKGKCYTNLATDYSETPTVPKVRLELTSLLITKQTHYLLCYLGWNGGVGRSRPGLIIHSFIFLKMMKKEPI